MWLIALWIAPLSTWCVLSSDFEQSSRPESPRSPTSWGPKACFKRTLRLGGGAGAAKPPPHPHHWGGLEGPSAPPDLPNCQADRGRIEPCLSSDWRPPIAA